MVALHCGHTQNENGKKYWMGDMRPISGCADYSIERCDPGTQKILLEIGNMPAEAQGYVLSSPGGRAYVSQDNNGQKSRPSAADAISGALDDDAAASRQTEEIGHAMVIAQTLAANRQAGVYVDEIDEIIHEKAMREFFRNG